MPGSYILRGACSAVSLAIVSAFSLPSLAQQDPPSPISVRTPPIVVLDLLRYDPVTDGPLIWIADKRRGEFMTDPARIEQMKQGADAARKDTPREFAERERNRIFTQDTLKLIAPRDQRVIADVPKIPGNPFAKMNSRDRFSVLLSLLSREQWQAATSEKGIGPAEMTDEQRALWSSFLPPDKITLQKNRLVPVDNHTTHYEREGAPQEFSPDSARLRLVRRVEFQFQKVGADDYGYSSGSMVPIGEPSDTIYTGNVDYTPDERRNSADAPQQAFGATVVKSVPNRLKKSDLSLSSPVFNTVLPLDVKAETVGELLARIGETTRFRLRCDKRVRDLKVYRRVAPGATASASDLLQAICLSIGATFRKIAPVSGEPVYLLTEDIEGIAARFLRWSDWAEEANGKRYQAVREAANKAAALDPLGMIGFAPNDPAALPPALLARVDAAYRKERYGSAPEMKISELPPGLRKEAKKQQDVWITQGTAIKTDTARVGTTLTCQLLFPGGIAVEPSSYGRNFGGQYLQKIAVVEKKEVAPPPAKIEPPYKPKALPVVSGRRVLLLPFPADPNGMQALLQAARSKGFSDVWLRVSLSPDEKQLARLKTAVKSGTKIGLRVGGVVDVLRGYKGTADMNVVETGAAFTERKREKDPDRDYYNNRYPGWNVWDGSVIKAGLLPIASVPGLSALTLQATAAPGYAGVVRGGDGIASGGHLGYTVATRLACIEANGFDPIDASDYSHTLEMDTAVGMFPPRDLQKNGQWDDGIWSELNTFRWKQNKNDMVRLHAALKAAAPTLPIYLNDRASSYSSPNSSWYVRWTKGDQIAICPCYSGESDHREAAFAVSPEAFLNQWSWDGKPSEFADAVAKAFVSSAKWSGVAVDCSYQSPTDALRLLSGIANAVK